MKELLRQRRNSFGNHRRFLFHRRYRSFFKKTLPLIGVALFVGILFAQEIFFWRGEDSVQTKALKQLDSLSHVGHVTNAIYSALNEKGHPYVIKAERAFSAEDNVVRLDNPLGSLRSSADASVQVISDTGVYHQAKRILELTGNVRLEDQEGNTISTTQSTIDLASSVVSSVHPVSGHGPMGDMKADSFSYDQDKGWLCLKGRACVIIAEEKSNR